MAAAGGVECPAEEERTAAGVAALSSSLLLHILSLAAHPLSSPGRCFDRAGHTDGWSWCGRQQQSGSPQYVCVMQLQ